MGTFSNHTRCLSSDSPDFTKHLFLGVNAACFLVYTTLAILVRQKLKDITIDEKSRNLMLLFFFAFLRKVLALLIS